MMFCVLGFGTLYVYAGLEYIGIERLLLTSVGLLAGHDMGSTARAVELGIYKSVLSTLAMQHLLCVS